MTLYILTPIDNTDDLPDGWYWVIDTLNDPDKKYFHKGNWRDVAGNHTKYLNPVPGATLLTREIAESIWDAADSHNEEERQYPYGRRAGNKNPGKQTYINELFKERK